MTPRKIVMWGNCQAAPIGLLLQKPLADRGFELCPVPPVFEVTPPQLQHVRDLVADAALLISQPVRDEYSVPGCGTGQLAAYLPPTGRLITFPSIFDSAAYPFQALAHDGGGARIAAPITDYHDLRLLIAATVDPQDWPPPIDAERLRVHAELSMQQLMEREKHCDVTVSQAIRQDRALFSINHPSNAVLGEVANRILALLEIDARVEPPEREFLGATRTPIESAPAAAFGWSAPTHEDWIVNGVTHPWSEVIEAHLAFYAAHPDVRADARVRFSARLETLGLQA